MMYWTALLDRPGFINPLLSWSFGVYGKSVCGGGTSVLSLVCFTLFLSELVTQSKLWILRAKEVMRVAIFVWFIWQIRRQWCKSVVFIILAVSHPHSYTHIQGIVSALRLSFFRTGKVYWTSRRERNIMKTSVLSTPSHLKLFSFSPLTKHKRARLHPFYYSNLQGARLNIMPWFSQSRSCSLYINPARTTTYSV